MMDSRFLRASVADDESALKRPREECLGGSFLTRSASNVFIRSYASDVTSGLSDGYEGLSEKTEKTAARRTAAKLFRRRARSRLRITGVT